MADETEQAMRARTLSEWIDKETRCSLREWLQSSTSAERCKILLDAVDRGDVWNLPIPDKVKETIKKRTEVARKEHAARKNHKMLLACIDAGDHAEALRSLGLSLSWDEDGKHWDEGSRLVPDLKEALDEPDYYRAHCVLKAKIGEKRVPVFGFETSQDVSFSPQDRDRVDVTVNEWDMTAFLAAVPQLGPYRAALIELISAILSRFQWDPELTPVPKAWPLYDYGIRDGDPEWTEDLPVSTRKRAAEDDGEKTKKQRTE